MDVFLVITQGVGLALACGIRPFLPVLLAGALAGANQGLSFGGTDYSFLESPVFLGLVVVALIAVVLVERRRPGATLEAGGLASAVAGIAAGLGALEFAGSLADEHHPAWPGLVAGVACALLAQAAVRGVLRRAGQRLDPEARGALPLYADGTSLVLAGLCILVPPASLVALGLFVLALVRGRRRDDSKYAGLRILR